MNLLSQLFCQQRSMRIGVSVVLCFIMLFVSYPGLGLAQGAAAKNALKLLGKFAMNVAPDVAGSLIDNEAKTMLHPDQQEPNHETSDPKISGYKFTLTWQTRNINYSGILIMKGTTGIFRVTTPQAVMIDQDMNARPYNDDVLLVGSNPRYAPTSRTPQNFSYSPDTFRLTQLSNGGWVIADTCDAQGLCAPVHVVEASVF